MEIDYRTFYLDLPVTEYDYVEDYIKNIFDFYFIAHEEENRKREPKPHFHVLLKCTKNEGFNCCNHFVRKYGLASKSGQHGGYRKYGYYGKGKAIHTEEQFMTYLCKDGNVRSSIGKDELKKYMDKSFKKEERDAHIHKVYEYLDTVITDAHFDPNAQYETYKFIKKEIIKYYIENDLKISPQYKSMILNYVRVSKLISKYNKISFICQNTN